MVHASSCQRARSRLADAEASTSRPIKTLHRSSPHFLLRVAAVKCCAEGSVATCRSVPRDHLPPSQTRTTCRDQLYRSLPIQNTIPFPCVADRLEIGPFDRWVASGVALRPSRADPRCNSSKVRGDFGGCGGSRVDRHRIVPRRNATYGHELDVRGWRFRLFYFAQEKLRDRKLRLSC